MIILHSFEACRPHWTSLACEGYMLRVDCYDFYKLGTKIHPLVNITSDVPLLSTWYPLYSARNELESFFSIFPLKVSIPSAVALRNAIAIVIPNDLGR